jgi:hypothetical protein
VCAAHDANLTTECAAAGGACRLLSGEEVDCAASSAWCGVRWCWVDRDACGLR